MYRVLSALFGLLVAVSAAAQESVPASATAQEIDFAADELTSSADGALITATGKVSLVRDGYRLQADSVAYNRKTGEVEARGNVAVTDPSGNRAYGDKVLVTDTLRDAAIENILVVLRGGGRMAARSGTRANDISTLSRATYSPCEIGGTDACPHAPVWQIKAVKVVHNPAKHRIRYKDAYLELFGLPILYMPDLSHPDGSIGNASGILVPDVRIDRQLGLEVATPIFFNLSPTSDLTLTPTFYTAVNPAFGLEYRKQTNDGPFRLGGFMTSASRVDNSGVTRHGFRGYLYGNGRLQHDPRLRSTFGLRLTTDDTFLRRYDVSRDVTLRNFYTLERRDTQTWLSVEGWAFQSLRAGDRQGKQPVALPLITFDWQPDLPSQWGRLQIKANTLAITRTDGEDVRRGTTSADYSLSRTTELGQRVTFTGVARADIYNVNQSALMIPMPGQIRLPGYSGREGWNSRAFAAGAVDVQWPLAGPAFGGMQTLTPRFQIRSSSSGRNLDIPNEDSRAAELDDLNLFDINRFPGSDRWESGTRMTYGGRWTLDRPRFAVIAEAGQSYRLSDGLGLFPDGSDATGRFSDYVGRTSLRFGSLVDVTHRFRIDKDRLAVRRNEIDLTVGGRRTFAEVGYLRLNRNITVEDLPDREEIRAGARVQVSRFWSVFGSAILDLTDRTDDPASNADGFEPVRHRLGVAYDDECFEFSVAWRRDYTSDRDFRRGNTFMLKFSFKNLGS